MNTDPLNLRRLPPLEPPPDLWAAIDQHLHQPGRPRWQVWAPAVAAAIAVALVLTVLMQGQEPTQDFGADPIQTSLIQAAMAQSANLESELRAREQGSVNARALPLLLLLEAELAWVDLRLAEQPQDLGLWQQRSELLTAMILRYAEPVELAPWSTELL